MYIANDQKDDGSQKAFPKYTGPFPGTDSSWYFGHWESGASGDTCTFRSQVLIGGVVQASGTGAQGTIGTSLDTGGTWEVYLTVQADRWTQNRYNASVNGQTKTGGSRTVKTIAAPVTFGTVAVSNPTPYTMDFSMQWYANTVDSYGVAHLYYKKTTDVAWSEWALAGTQRTGNTLRTESGTITGLTAGTSYQFRLGIWRNVSNPSGYTASEWTYSATQTLSTLAPNPVLSTNDASSVAHSSAQLNGTVDCNLLTTTLTFLWNKCARRTIAYSGQPAAGEKVTVGSNEYIFKDNAAASGELDYNNATQPTAGKKVTVGTLDYTFREEVVSTGGNLSYTDGTPPTADQTVTVPDVSDTKVYKFVAAVANDWEVKIEATADDSFTNLKNAINRTDAPGAGDNQSGGKYMAPTAHTLFSAAITTATDDVDLTTLQVGPVGNVTLATTCSDASVTSPSGGSWVASQGDVLIGASPDDTLTNLSRAINDSGGTSGVGEDYIPAGGAAHPDVTAAIDTGTDKVTVTAIEKGSAGNSIVLSTDESSFTAPGTLSSGADLPGTDDYEVLIDLTDDATLLNLQYCVNKSGGTAGINYNAVAAHPDVVATLHAADAELFLDVPTNLNPALTFTTDVAGFTLTTDVEDPFAQETASQVLSNDGDTQFGRSIAGLDTRRTYYFKAKATWVTGGGGTLYGDEKSFTTSAEPGAASLEEEHMQTIQFDGHYGQAKTVSFVLRAPSGSSSDLYYTGTAPLQADCLIFKDGVYDNTSDNAPAQVGATQLYTLVLSATEMQAETVDLVIHDASGSAFRDQHIQVRTAQRLSELDVDATNGPTDASAITAIGNGAGAGILAASAGTGADINGILASMWLRAGTCQVASAGNKCKFDTGASSVNEYYTGNTVCIISGTGAGQARSIISYLGSQREATLDSNWSTAPDTSSIYGVLAGAQTWTSAPGDELQAMPSLKTPSFGEMLQLLYQRFTFKINQTASAQTWFNTDGDELFVRTVSDDGVTQTIEELTGA